MSQRTLNFDKPLVGFDGKESGEGSLGQVLARVLGSESSDDKLEFIKLAEWVRLLWSKEPLSLDKSDHNKLKDIVERTKGLNVWLKAQMFEVLEDSVSEEKPKQKSK